MRAMPLRTIVAGVTAGAVPLALATTFGSDISALPVLAIALTASAAGFTFDDNAADTLESSPTTIGRRRWLRVVITGSVVASGWLLDLLAMRRDGINAGHLIDHRTLALAALAATAIAIAAVVNHHELDQQGGAVGATSAVFVLAATEVLSVRWPAQFPSVISDATPNDRWWWLLATATVVIVWFSRDPGTPHRKSSG
jgi:cytochrome bd-type quinol oxidase subunit 2